MFILILKIIIFITILILCFNQAFILYLKKFITNPGEVFNYLGNNGLKNDSKSINKIINDSTSSTTTTAPASTTTTAPASTTTTAPSSTRTTAPASTTTTAPASTTTTSTTPTPTPSSKDESSSENKSEEESNLSELEKLKKELDKKKMAESIFWGNFLAKGLFPGLLVGGYLNDLKDISIFARRS